MESRVRRQLSRLSRKHPAEVNFSEKPSIALQNGEMVRPDFSLQFEFPHITQHYLIECQNRKNYSKELLHKVQHIRNKSRHKSFIFVSKDRITTAHYNALKNEGIIALDLKAFKLYLERLSLVLGKLKTIKHRKEERSAEHYAHMPALVQVESPLMLILTLLLQGILFTASANGSTSQSSPVSKQNADALGALSIRLTTINKTGEIQEVEVRIGSICKIVHTWESDVPIERGVITRFLHRNSLDRVNLEFFFRLNRGSCITTADDTIFSAESYEVVVRRILDEIGKGTGSL